MLLVWGRKWYTHKLGFVADFCEICRRPQPFTLERHSLTGHFWYVPMGTTHAVRHQARCSRCAIEVTTELRRYAQVAKKAASVRDLLAATLPNYEQVLKERMEFERVVRDDVAALPPDLRRGLLVRPFVALSPMVERRFATKRIDAWVAAGLASIFVLPPLGYALCAWLYPGNEYLGALFELMASIVLIVWATIGVERRWICKFVAPRLIGSLGPLRATSAEVEGVIAELRAHKHKLGKYLRGTDLQPERV